MARVFFREAGRIACALATVGVCERTGTVRLRVSNDCDLLVEIHLHCPALYLSTGTSPAG